MNPHANPSTSPLHLVKNLYKNRRLIIDLVKREIIGRYKGSAMGLLWSFFNPLLMLAVYSFVFGFVFKSRWQGGTGSNTEFALVLFAGLLIFNFFSEILNRAPSLILNNANYVKKVIFPLDILPVVALGSAFFHMLISLLVWLIFYFIFFGAPSPNILYLPLVIIPLLFLTLGLAWFFSSLGVYLRDVGQFMGIATTVLMFLSPIFYPITSLPEKYQQAMYFSPLTYVVEEARNVMLWNKGINWADWLMWTCISVVVALVGFVWFQKTRRGFADVL